MEETIARGLCFNMDAPGRRVKYRLIFGKDPPKVV